MSLNSLYHLWRRYNPYPKILDVLAPKIIVEFNNVQNIKRATILNLSHFAIYKALFQPDTSKSWASIRVIAKDKDNYPLEWLNPFLLSLAT